ncbi:transcriptional regulator [Paenibacillus antibioticophila]|uniref:Transcriptional regulator n=1 Tax=Paenibacillus antibioticophila TaxID=1274374 RepID=A0A919XSK6_9BACL|nr:AraC family transcriptional regulator [Paenibacillus antibioticophila]GIO35902.1 transcriptional regulator [Paenibacillus antibioticophila]
MSIPVYRRFVFPSSANPHLPLIVESVGCNPDQEKVNRPEGYPCYHWLQTDDGEGRITYAGETIILKPNSGILLPPGMPHAYEAIDRNKWGTYYLTFGGEAAGAILSAYAIHEPARFDWESDSVLSGILASIVDQLQLGEDPFGLEVSSAAYRFLGLLSKYGQASRIPVTRGIEKLQPLLTWISQNYDNPDIGLDTLAEVLNISGRQLNQLFQSIFAISPYAYLIQHRIHKAKEQLAGQPDLTVIQIAGESGFRDASHFVATFRRHTGMTPQQFRKLHI